MIFFTSDTHFGHDNIIKYCNRPYGSAAAMDFDLIKNWNTTVSESDTIYVLGDFIWGKDKLKIAGRVRGLNGQIILVRGNHDRDVIYEVEKLIGNPSKFKVVDYLELKCEGYKFVMSHYPITSWNGAATGSIDLHGHSHGMIPSTNQQYDVGVDANNHKYKPISVIDLISNLQKLPDHKFVEVVKKYDNR